MTVLRNVYVLDLKLLLNLPNIIGMKFLDFGRIYAFLDVPEYQQA